MGSLFRNCIRNLTNSVVVAARDLMYKGLVRRSSMQNDSIPYIRSTSE